MSVCPDRWKAVVTLAAVAMKQGPGGRHQYGGGQQEEGQAHTHQADQAGKGGVC